LNVSQLQTTLYKWVKTYWDGATVAWGATNKVKPQSPLVIIQLGTVTRSIQPITQAINGIVFSAYPSEVPLQVDLFTRGGAVETDDGEYYDNTSTTDMLDFLNFIDSVATIEWSNINDISISLLSGVQDLSQVINDSQWQYRAMVELNVSFTQWSAEHNGVLGEASIIFGEDGLPTGVDSTKWQQTPSGGGSQKLADEETGFFEEIQPKIEEEITHG